MKCKALTENTIVFEYSKNWYEENVEPSIVNLSNSYSQLSVLETLVGADRQSIRIEWQQYQYTLHVEHYSESLWLEALDEHALTQLSAFYRYLAANNG